jgi:PAS domain-containing protein
MWHGTSAHIGETIWESPDPAFIVGPDGRISAWNRAAELFFGVAAGEALGQPCAQVVRGFGLDGLPACSPYCPALRKARLGASPPAEEMTVKAAGMPSRRPKVWVHHLAVADSIGNPSGVLHLLSEINAEGGG